MRKLFLLISLFGCLLFFNSCSREKEAEHYSEEEFLKMIYEEKIVIEDVAPEITGDIENTISYMLPAAYSTKTPIYLSYTVNKDTKEVVGAQLSSKKEVSGDMQIEFLSHAQKLMKIMDRSLNEEEIANFSQKLYIKEANGNIEIKRNRQLFFMKIPDTGVVFAIFPEK